MRGVERVPEVGSRDGVLELAGVRGEEENTSDAARYARGPYSVRQIAIGLQLDPSRVRGFAERHGAG